MATHKATNPVRTAEMTMKVIEGLERLEGATLTDLAVALDEPKSTVHNHVSTLLEHEYVVKEDNVYHLGLRFTELGELSKNRYPVFKTGESEIEKLAELTGELVNLAVEEHGKLVYLHRARGENAITTDTFSGKRVDLHCTSLGKALLSFMPEERVHEIITQSGLPARTENTITDLDELFEELSTAREHRIAFDNEERAYGIRCVAAPILKQKTKEPVGAVSVSAPVNRMKEKRFSEEIPELLHNTVNVIEIELDHLSM